MPPKFGDGRAGGTVVVVVVVVVVEVLVVVEDRRALLAVSVPPVESELHAPSASAPIATSAAIRLILLPTGSYKAPRGSAWAPGEPVARRDNSVRRILEGSSQ